MMSAGQIRHQLNREGDIPAKGNHKRCLVQKASNLVAGVGFELFIYTSHPPICIILS